ncbi:MAG: flagellar motor switch protein FliN [candidate division FCPU426 bacterium]
MASAVLNDTQKTALEGALQGAGDSAGSTLSNLLSRKVTLTPAGVSSMSPSDLAERYMGGVVHVEAGLSGELKGKALFVFQENIAALMADLMIGGDGSNPPDSLSDLHLSAVGEVGNQMASAFCEALGAGLGKKLSAAPGDLASCQAADLAGIAAPLGSNLVASEFAMEVENGPSGTFFFLLSPETAASLAGSGGSDFTATSQFSGSAGAPVVQPAQMGQLSAGGFGGGGNNLDLLMDVPLQVTVELGRTQKLVKEVLAMGPGSVVELDKLAGEPVDILVNEKPIAKGEVVVIDENFGIRVTEILSPKDRLNF